MTDKELFQVVGIQKQIIKEIPPTKKKNKLPVISIGILSLIVIFCLLSELFINYSPSYLNLEKCYIAPCREFIFGTDSLGRDMFSCILYGGRISLLIGVISTVISTSIAVIYGSICGVSSKTVDIVLTRIMEIFFSVPSLLITIFIQAIIGKASVISISVAVGIVSWCDMAKIIRTEVQKIFNSEFVIASKCMGAGFFHILVKHLIPNYISSITFMVIMNVKNAIIAESTLSFMGIGLPIEITSWGSMLSLAQESLLSGAWWVIIIPGAFIISVIMCLTSIGNYLKKTLIDKQNNM